MGTFHTELAEPLLDPKANMVIDGHGIWRKIALQLLLLERTGLSQHYSGERGYWTFIVKSYLWEQIEPERERRLNDYIN